MALPVFDNTKHHVGLAETTAGDITLDEANVASATGVFGGGANPSFTVPTENEVAPGGRLFVAIALDTGGSAATDATVSIDGLTFVEMFDGENVGHGHHGIAGYFDCPDGLPAATDIDVSATDSICWGWSLAASSFLATYGFEDETAVDVNLSSNADVWASDATAIANPSLIVTLVMTKENLTSAPDAGTLEANDQAGTFASASIAYRIESADDSYTLSGTFSGTSFGCSFATQAFRAAGAPTYGLMIEGGYHWNAQRFGTPAEFGGERDTLAPSVLSRWTQDDFSGGAYQELWGSDVAMFWDCEGFLPALLERSLRTVPPMVYWALPGHVDAADALAVFASGAHVQVVEPTTTRAYAVSDGTLVDTANTGVRETEAACHDPNDNLVYTISYDSQYDASPPSTQLDGDLGKNAETATVDSTTGFPSRGIIKIGHEYVQYTGKTSTTFTGLVRGRETSDKEAHDDNDAVTFQPRRELRRFSHALSPETIGYFPKAGGRVGNGIEVAGKDFVAAVGQTLFLCDVNDDRDDTNFTRIGRLPGQWKDSCVYNGLVYILVTDSEQRTALTAWDGSSLQTITEFPYNFIGNCLAVYGGRIYVGGAGQDITGANKYGELYEITGASLRLVRSWSTDARSGRAAPTTINDLCVHEGLLFVASDVSYLVSYDLTRDALFGGPEIIPDGAASVETKFLLSTRQKLFAWCDDPTGTGGTSGDGFYRLATNTADLTDDPDTAVASYDCWIETSDFSPEPARDKRWSEAKLVTRKANASTPTTPTVEYSTDGGATWTTLATSVVVNGAFKETTIDLGDVPISKAVRFRFTFSLSSVIYDELLAFTVSFLMLDEDKRVYSFTVLGVESVEALDSTTLDLDLASLKDSIVGWWEDKSLLEFTDLDGDVRRVMVTDIGGTRAFIGERLSDGTREGSYSVVLTEV